MTFSRTFFLLQQEGFLIESCVYTGLTALRNARLDNRGSFYTAFFQLSIAIERVAKLIIILDYMAENNLNRPNNKFIKKYSHNLLELTETVYSIADKRNLTSNKYLNQNTIEHHILKFLSSFAHISRYANIDELTGNMINTDPLEEWSTIIKYIIDNDISNSKKIRVQEISDLYAKELANNHRIVAHDLENNPLSLEGMLVHLGLNERVGAYSVWHVLEIVSPLAEIMFHVAVLAQITNQIRYPEQDHIPAMNDFLRFVSSEKALVLRKKRWP